MGRSVKCTRCRLSLTRRCITEALQADVKTHDLVFICEGPSKVGEMFGQPLGKQELNILQEIIEDARELAEVRSITYAVTSMVLCRPCNEKNGEGRAAYPDEVLACAGNFIEQLPPGRHFVLVGKQVERFYKKEFPDARTIQHPSFLMKQGESWKRMTARILSEVILNG